MATAKPTNEGVSDTDLREAVSDTLQEAGALDASEIEVDVTASVVTLTGTVTSHHMKLAAEEAAKKVRGVTEVHNQLRIGETTLSSDSQSGLGIGMAPSAAAPRQPQKH